MTPEDTEDQLAAPNEDQQLWYLDTSVAVRILLADLDAATWWNTKVAASDAFVSSRLLHLEMTRVLRREQLDASDVDEFVKQLTLLDVDNSLLKEAAAIEPHVKALDSLHLASALRVGSATLATHDAAMIKVGRQLGLAVIDPISG